MNVEDNEYVSFTSIGPVIELPDGSEVTVNVSDVDTDGFEHSPGNRMMMYVSHPSEEYSVYGSEVDGANAAITIEEVDQ